MPALVVAAQHDLVEPVELLRENLLPSLADGDVAVVPEVGHLIPLEAPDELGALIAGFTSASRPSR